MLGRLVVGPRPRRTSIASGRIGAVGVLVEEDTQVIALWVPVIDIADGVIDLSAGPGIVSAAGEKFVVGRGPAKHPRRSRGQVQRQEEESRRRHVARRTRQKRRPRKRRRRMSSYVLGTCGSSHAPPPPPTFVSTCLLVAEA